MAAAGTWTMLAAAPAPTLAPSPAPEAQTDSRVLAATHLGRDLSARGIVLLYELAGDASPDVQRAAFTAVKLRCPREAPQVCRAMLRFFVSDDDQGQLSCQARDVLLFEAPYVAIDGASLAYKLDVVARLSERADQPGNRTRVLQLLRLLAEDPAPQVQEAAGAILLRAKL